MKYFLILSVLFGVSCAHNPQEKFLMGNLYYQKAPEVKALSRQAYNSATDYLLKNVVRKKSKQCIVLDIDETVLDNSPYQGWLYKNQENYRSKTWEKLVMLEKAKALPGSLEFIKLAMKKGVRVLYVTNRKQHLVEATLNNLSHLGLKVNPQDIIGRTTTSSKVERRKDLSKGCEVAMLIGDSLADFDPVFEGSYDLRHQGVESFSKEWGRKFIILPNPMYGDWLKGAGSQKLQSFDEL